jgi:hypothetical protein
MVNRDAYNQVVELGRDVFVGIAEVDSYVFRRDLDPPKRLEINDRQGRLYFDIMFSLIFQDLKSPGPRGDMGFCWLTWVVVPLVEALEGRFNPIGMGGIGNC